MKIIKGKKILLRPREMKDVSYIVKWYGNKDLMMYYGHEKYRVTEEQEKKHVLGLKKKDCEEESFMIVTDDDRVIGTIGFDKNECNRYVGLYIMIGDKKFQDKGYARMAINLMLEYIFKEKTFFRVELNVSEPYKKALHLYESIGFKKEGVRRKAGWNKIAKNYENVVVMGMLKDEWLKNKN
ncbi:MAG TPA: hypothetical protein DEB09_02735 [Candidatus Magasanikbacteria bacterium]|nr:hypothetical protein [Candidatus Magasanikbacteria bacterium]